MSDMTERETAYLAGMYDGMLYALEQIKDSHKTDLNPSSQIKNEFWQQFLNNIKARVDADNFFIKRDVIFDGGFEYWEQKQANHTYGAGLVARQLTCSCGSSDMSCDEDPNGYYSRFVITKDGPKRYLFELGTHKDGV